MNRPGKRIYFLLSIMMGWAVFALTSSAYAQAIKKQTIKLAVFFSPSYEVPLYALKEGKIKSDLVEPKFYPMDIAAMIQAMGTGEYDVVDLAATAFPMARKRGLDLVILGANIVLRTGHYVVVKPDSPIKSMAQLKGKDMGVPALGATSTIQTRLVLEKKYNLRTGLKGADVNLVEVPLASIPALLEMGKIDSAYVFGVEGYEALKNNKVRILADVGADYMEAFGTLAATSLWVGYADRVKKNPEAYRELMRLLRASIEYAQKNPGEVYPTAAKKYKVDPDFLRVYWDKWRYFSASLDDENKKMIEKLWQLSKEFGYLEDYPPISEVSFR